MKHTHYSKRNTALKVFAGVLIVLLIAFCTVGVVSADTPVKRDMTKVSERTISPDAADKRMSGTTVALEKSVETIKLLLIQGITEPEYGEAADLSVEIIGQDGIKSTYVSWRDGDYNIIDALVSDKTFKQGTPYTVSISIIAKDGFAFSTDVKAVIVPDGKMYSLSDLSSYPSMVLSSRSADGKSVIFTKEYPPVNPDYSVVTTPTTEYKTATVYTEPVDEVVTELAIQGITEPEYGEAADLSVSIAQNVVKSTHVFWQDGDYNTIDALVSDKTFKQGTPYTVGVSIIAKDGFVFSKDTKAYIVPAGKIKFELSSYPSMELSSISDDGKTIIFTKEYPPVYQDYAILTPSTTEEPTEYITATVYTPTTPEEVKTTEDVKTTEEVKTTEDVKTTEEVKTTEDVKTTEEVKTTEDVKTTEEVKTTEDVKTTEEVKTTEDAKTTGTEKTTGTTKTTDVGKVTDEVKTKQPTTNIVAQFFATIFALFGFA